MPASNKTYVDTCGLLEKVAANSTHSPISEALLIVLETVGPFPDCDGIFKFDGLLDLSHGLIGIFGAVQSL